MRLRRREKVEALKKSSQVPKEAALAPLPLEMRSNLMRSVNDLVQKGIQLWLAESNPQNPLDRLDFDPHEDISFIRKDTFNWILRSTAESIDSITDAIINGFEIKFGPQI